MPKLSRVRSRFGFVGSLALGLALGSPALVGQTTTWGGTGSTTSTSSWGAYTNWSNGDPGSTGRAAVFDGQGQTTITGASVPVAGITFNAGSYTITTGGKFSLTSGITVAAGTQTFNGTSIGFSNNQTWSVAAGAALNVLNSIRLHPNNSLTLDGDGNFDLSGSLSESTSGSATFTKTGSGTAILRGAANTTVVPMTVSAGTLLINGDFSSATGTVTVNGGTLGGTGSMRKNTTINAGGTLAPGASPGVLAFGGALTLATGSTTAFELNGTTRGTDYDGLNITGLTTFGGTLELDFGSTFADGTTLDLFALGGVPAGSFDFITGIGGYAGSFTNVGGLWTMESGGQLLSFSQSTGDLTFSAAPVPEPATSVALAGATALAIVAWRRGRGRRTSREEAGKRS